MARRDMDEAVERARAAVDRAWRDKRAEDERAQRLRDIGWDDRADERSAEDALWHTGGAR